MFRQKFQSTEEFLSHCYEKRGLSISTLHFVLQENDHEILDELIRILLRTNRWNTSQSPLSSSNNKIIAQFPYQDEAFAAAMGINQGFQPSSQSYPLCVTFQQGNPIMIDTMYILRSNNITTEKEFDQLIRTSPVRLLQQSMLITPHHYTRAQMDLCLHAEALVRILSDPNEHFSHWCKFDSASEHEISSIQETYPQFSEHAVARLTQYRILTAIWQLPHPKLLALITANRAESVINRTQCLIRLEKVHIPYLLSTMVTLSKHIHNCKKQEQMSPTIAYDDYLSTTFDFTRDPIFKIEQLMPDGYFSNWNIGNTNPLNGNKLHFTSFQDEILFVETLYQKYKQILAILFTSYDWQSMHSSTQSYLLTMSIYHPQLLQFLPWLPIECDVETAPDLSKLHYLHSFKKNMVDNFTIIDNRQSPNFEKELLLPFTNDLVQIIHDNRKYIMPIINKDIYGTDILIIAPEFAHGVSTDQSLSTFPLHHSSASSQYLFPTPEEKISITSSPQLSSFPSDSQIDQLTALTKSDSNSNDNTITMTTSALHDKSQSEFPTSLSTDLTRLAISADSFIDVALTPPSDESETFSQDTSSTSPTSPTSALFPILSPTPSTTSSKSCLPFDHTKRRQKRNVHFNPVLYHTDDEQPLVRGGKTLGHTDDLTTSTQRESMLEARLSVAVIKCVISFLILCNMTSELEFFLDVIPEDAVDGNVTLNSIMGIQTDPKENAPAGYGPERQSQVENLIALACTAPHCTPYTILWLLKKKAKLCTNNKNGRKNNAFFVLYSTEPHWLHIHAKFTKLLVLWAHVKSNERIYKPHIDFRDFMHATIQLLFHSSLQYHPFVFILENLLNVTERSQARQNAIRICDIISVIYYSQHSTGAQSVSATATRMLSSTSANGIPRQFTQFPSHANISSISSNLPPIIKHTQYLNNNNNNNTSMNGNELTATISTTVEPVERTTQELQLQTTSPIPTLYFYNLPPTTSLRDAYAQYESQDRLVFLQYFINKSTIGLFLPPSEELTILDEYPSDLFLPIHNNLIMHSDIESEQEEVYDDEANSSMDTPPSEQSFNDTSAQKRNPEASSPTFSTGSTSSASEPDSTTTLRPRGLKLPHNVKSYIATTEALEEVSKFATSQLQLISPLHYTYSTKSPFSPIYNPLDASSQNSGRRNSAPQSPTLSASSTASTLMGGDNSGKEKILPKFLTNNLPTRAQPRDHLQQLMFPFLESRDLTALRYLFDLGITAKNMWQRLLAVQHVFFDIRDIVEYIPREFYEIDMNFINFNLELGSDEQAQAYIDKLEERFNIQGLSASNIIENPWLTTGNELKALIKQTIKTNTKQIIAHARVALFPDEDPSSLYTPQNHSSSHFDFDDSVLPSLEDIDVLIQAGINVEEQFGSNIKSTALPLVFKSPNTIPFLSYTFLTTRHTSPMLQLLQLFLLYDNSLHEISLAQGPHNLSTTAALCNCWPLVQALYLTNTDTFNPASEDIGKYYHALYVYPEKHSPSTQQYLHNIIHDHSPLQQNNAKSTNPSQSINSTQSLVTSTSNVHNPNTSMGFPLLANIPPQQTTFKEFIYDPDLVRYFKHDLLSILSNPSSPPSIPPSPTSTTLQQTPQSILPPRVYAKLTNPTLSNLRTTHLILPDQFTPTFHTENLHTLLMFFLPQRNMNPIQDYFSIMLFEFVFSHVLREYSMFGPTQREELLIYVRRSLVVHSFLPQSEKGLYEGPVDNIIRVIAQHGKDALLRRERAREQMFVNSIKNLYKYSVIFNAVVMNQFENNSQISSISTQNQSRLLSTKSSNNTSNTSNYAGVSILEPEYVVLFLQSHLLHSSIALDWYYTFVKSNGNWTKVLPIIQDSVMTVLSEFDTPQSYQKCIDIVQKFHPDYLPPLNTPGTQ